MKKAEYYELNDILDMLRDATQAFSNAQKKIEVDYKSCVEALDTINTIKHKFEDRSERFKVLINDLLDEFLYTDELNGNEKELINNKIISFKQEINI